MSGTGLGSMPLPANIWVRSALTGSLLPSSLHGIAFSSLRPGAQSCPVSFHSELLISPMNVKSKTGSSFLVSPGWPGGCLRLGHNELASSEHCIMYLSLFYKHAWSLQKQTLWQ